MSATTATRTPPARSDGLVVDGLALGGSALLSAIAGFLSWLIVARTQPQAVVSLSSAFVNAFILVASLAELSLGPALLRWLPQAGHRAGALIKNVYACVLIAAIPIGGIWLLLPATRSVLAATSPLSPEVGAALFLVCAMSWTLFHLQDEVLTGLRVARWVPLENLLAAAVRLVLLVALTPFLNALGIVLAWAITTVVAVLSVSVGVRFSLRGRQGIAGTLPSRREVARFSGPMYPATIASSVTAHLVPLIVIARYGPDDGAVFFIVWMGLSALELAGVGLGNALATRLADGSRWSSRYVARSSTRFVLLALPVLAVGFAVAGVVLAIFGPAYQEAGTGLLRWIIAGFAVRLLVLMGTAVYIGAGRGVRVALAQGANAAFAVMLVLFLPTTELNTIGIGFVVGQVVLASVVVIDAIRLVRGLTGRSRHGH